MTVESAEVLRNAMSLPPDARAALAGSLLESLDAEFDADANDAWRDEIPLRIEQIDNGRVRMIPWAEARSALEARIGA